MRLAALGIFQVSSSHFAGAAVCVLAAALWSTAAFADPAATTAPDDQGPVHSVIVTGKKQPKSLAASPAVVETFSAQQIQDSVNIVTSAEALKYLPSIEVRERSIGDRNGIVSTRTTGTVSSAESMVFADDLLISNLLGNSYNYPPRWGLVAPSEIERVDVIYGPFSALYPGNSLGGVITLETKTPTKPELHLAATGALEDFKLYGSDQHNGSGDLSFGAGDRWGPLSVWVDYDHLNAEGHPLSFATSNLSTKAAAAAPVMGAYQDYDQNGNARLVFGGYSIDHTTQDQGKIKLGYDLTPTVRFLYTLAVWGDASVTDADTFLTNTTTGQPFYNGAVNIAGKAYTVSGDNPGRTSELHMANAFSLGSDTLNVFDWKIAYSNYDYLTEDARSASTYGQTLAGADQHQKGTGWQTLDLRGVWRPGQVFGQTHEVSFGYHIDDYILKQTTYNVAVWNTGADGAVASGSGGETRTQGIYAQDLWTLSPKWTATLGLRDEFWHALNGYNLNASTKPTLATYPSQRISDLSPKAALAYQVTPAVETRLSFGRAVRFPTVNELYQQVTSGTTLVQNNPNLKPEDAQSYDWSTQYLWRQDLFRVSLFEEDRRNALFSQTDSTISPNLTQIENINLVRIRGVETAIDLRDVFIKGLDISSSGTYADAYVLKDEQAPTAVGKEFPRIPRWRARLVAVYHQGDKITYSVGYRYSSGAYSTLLNTDINHDTYGGISQYSVFDLKVDYKLHHGVTASVGVDNLGDDRYYVSPHPYPQRTSFVGLKYDY
jgi:iron complex outermembrane receptor protein